MGDRIFFKDKMDTLKGPYTERQVQEWYRKGWFDNNFRFYFTESDEPPNESTNNGITLDSLRSRNGNASPFIYFDKNEKMELEKYRGEIERRLEKIEKEMADLQQNCTAVLSLKERIEGVEKMLQKLTARSMIEEISTPFEIPAVVEAPQDPEMIEGDNAVVEEEETEEEPDGEVEEPWWERKLGESFADLVLDAFSVYASGEYDSWDKRRVQRMESILGIAHTEEEKRARNGFFESILVEKMKENEFFCCDICQHPMFNYKQALIHFTSKQHCAKEFAEAKKSGVVQFRRILDAFTELPSRLATEDAKVERQRLERYGYMNVLNWFELRDIRPVGDFVYDFCVRYGERILSDSILTDDPFTGKPRMALTLSTVLYGAQTAVANAKGPIGRKAFAELHKHLGQSQASTYCVFCNYKTGDREGFYAHLVSSTHMLAVAKDTNRFDLLTLLVNMHRKDLI